MSKWNELKSWAEAVIGLNKTNQWDWVASVEDGRLGKTHTSFALAANPAAILELIAEVEALREKTSELNFDAARYCYLATTTWSDDVTDALCTSDKDQIDQAIDAELMRASA